MSFPKIDGIRRTDEMFRQRVQYQHHKEKSLIEDLNIDMINAFPTSDPLHLLELGIMKTCLSRWVFGKKGYHRKWKSDLVKNVSNVLIKFNKQMPSDIHRSVRSLNSLKYWKGVEYRTFLLYIGIVALKDALPLFEYTHFLTLCCAVTICSCGSYQKYIPLAKQMFDAYINGYINIYGRDTITSNVHNLTHITEDMENLGISNLMDISTYKYENCLRLIGLNLRNCNLPLEQISRRITEAFNSTKLVQYDLEINERPREFIPQVQYEVKNSCDKMYNKILVKPNVMLSNRKHGDKWFLTRTGDIVKFNYAIEKGKSFQICGSRIKNKEAFFTSPLDSKKLHIYQSDGELDDDFSFYDVDQVMVKLVCLSIDQVLVTIPLLHSLEMLK